jgi:hypothetical protein
MDSQDEIVSKLSNLGCKEEQIKNKKEKDKEIKLISF